MEGETIGLVVRPRAADDRRLHSGLSKLDVSGRARRVFASVLATVTSFGTVFALAGLPSAAAGQNEPTPVRSFRNFDKRSAPGLPQSTATALLQDARGILWIATLDGLATFDGTAILPVPEAPHAPVRGALRALAPRRAGGLYAGGSTAVHMWDGEAWSAIPAPGESFSLAEDEAGVLWRVDQAGHVLVLGGGAWRPAPLPEEVGAGVAVRATDAGSLWVAGQRGVLVRRQGEWRRVAGGEPPSPITAFRPADGDVCWIGTRAGRIFHAGPDDGGWRESRVPGWRGGWIRVLEEDRRGRIWAGGNEGDVAFGRAGEAWTVWNEYHGLHPEGRMAIFADREGTIWLAANGHGLQQWVGEAWSHRNLWLGQDLPERRALVFGVSGTRDGGILAAVFNRGVWHWVGREMRQYGEEAGLTRDVRMAVEPEPGVIWVGARFGIFESRGGGRFRQVHQVENGFVYGFHRSPDGTWYASTSIAGVHRRSASGWAPAESLNRALPNANVRDLLWRGEHELWVATMGGVAVFLDGELEALLQDGDPHAPIGVNALLQVGDEVWAGDFQGIRVWDDSRSRRLGPEDGVPGHTVYSLALAPDGAVWAGGSAGVGRFDPADGTWTRFDLSNGLIEVECNLDGLWPAPDGSVYVGTMASLARFDPRVAPLPRPALKVIWRERPAADATLPASRRSVRLAWTAPWLAPRAVEYRTRIRRLRPEWSAPQDDGYLTLENLGPGDWQVEVAARFAGEREWTEPVAARFRIAPYFWETWIFYLLCAGVLVLAVAATIRWRTRRLATRAHKLELAVEEQITRIKVLRGLLPICAGCKKVRDDAGYWRQIEHYIREHSEADFSHGLCPDCLTELYPDLAELGKG